MSRPPTGLRAHRRYSTALTATFGGLMLLFAASSTVINPLWVTTNPLSSPAFDDFKPIHKSLRTGKSGIVRTFDWDAVLLGSSRVDIALDPLHPGWGDLRVANLALRGGNICENLAMLGFAAEHEPLKQAIVGLDLTDLISPGSIPIGAGFEESPLDPHGSRFEKQLRYTFGFSTFELSVKAANYLRRGEKSAYTPQGHWIRQFDKRPIRSVIEDQSFGWARHFVAQRQQAITLNPDKVRALRDMIRLCRSKDIKLTLFLPPNHAAFLSAYRLLDDPDPDFRIDREAILRVVAEENQEPGGPQVTVWDFNSFHPYNCDPLPPLDQPALATRFWHDGTHATVALGNIMLARMMDWPPGRPEDATYGRKLTLANLDQRLAEIEEGFARYQREQPEDFAWIKGHFEDPPDS